MIELVKSLDKIINSLRLKTHLSILDRWQRQDRNGVFQDLPMGKSKKDVPMLTFLLQEQNIHIRQIWQVPKTYAGLSTLGSTIRLNLIWWADLCEVWINDRKVQEGDLFDQKCRLLLLDNVDSKANNNDQDCFQIDIKLNSPKHDIGALQQSDILFEYLHQPCDPNKFADELAVLQTYLPILATHKVDLKPIETAIADLDNLLVDNLENNDHSHSNLFVELAKIREPLLQYSEFLKQRQIYILGNSHIDVAWLWAIAETKKAMQRTFRSALNLQKQYPELIFNQSTALSYEWMEQEDPELFGQIQEAVQSGKWELIGGMWVEPDGNLPSGESLIRQILYGQEYFRKKFNREVKIAWLPDTFGFHWQMPQILAKSGFAAFVTQKLMWNDTNRFPHQVFWWQGVDGSQIFTYFSNEIGRGIEPVAIAKYLATQESQHGIISTAWLYGVGDHGGGPTADMLDIGRDWADNALFFQIQPSTLEHFLLDLKSQPLPDLPVWKNELYLEFHRGTFTSKADQKCQHRQAEVLIGNAEKYSAIATLVNNSPYPQAKLEQAWKGLLLNQFHDILPGTSIREVFEDADRTWEEVRAICAEILPFQEPNVPLQAWNFLNWQRSQLVEMPDQSLAWLTVPSFGFADLSTAITETDLPLSVEESKQSQHTFHLENQFLRLDLDAETGEITQIFDKRSQQNILQASIRLQFFADQGQYWDAWNIDPNFANHVLESATLEAIAISEDNNLCKSIRIVHKFRQSTFTQEIYLTAFESFVTVKNWVDWQEESVLVKVAFPVNWRSLYATYEIPMATIQRRTLYKNSEHSDLEPSENPLTPEDRAKWEVPAQYWADIASHFVGLSVLNDSKYGYDAQPDCLRLTLLRSPRWACPDSDRGNHEFSYRLVPHQGNWREANIVRLAQEFNNPLVLQNSPVSSPQQHSQSYLQIPEPNIILSAFKRSQDQAAWIMRLYESHGIATETSLQIFPNQNSPYILDAIQECDLMENICKDENGDRELSLVDHTIKLKFHPYEIKTLRLQLKLGY